MSTIKTTNPYNQKELATYHHHTDGEIDRKLQDADTAFKEWRAKPIAERVGLLGDLKEQLESNKKDLATLITREMGKPIKESIAEIEKCAWLCDFYAVNAENFLADALIETDARESFISYDPLGVILAIMPWNYPFWQVFRFAVPTLTAGNTAVLKHASITTGCALKIQELFEAAGYPKACFQTLLADHDQVEKVLSNDIVKAVSLTGSEKAGAKIAEIAGRNLKKSVLELGGNNACAVWEDADLDRYMPTMVNARMKNAGQSCIAAKRFIVVEEIYDQFLDQFKSKVAELKSGDPMDSDTDIATLADIKFIDTLKDQVRKSLDKGAKVHYGNNTDKAFYQPTVITDVKPGMPLFDEEVFGPIAAVIKVKDRAEAITLASDSRFGLGTMLFTEDIAEARKQIGKIPDGGFHINELSKSDPRLPFGGTKKSGYGRELSKEGMLEFVNVKTVYVK